MNNTLYIFGNGFDLFHEIKTKYSDFRDWLIKKYKIDPNEDYYQFDLPGYGTNYKGLEDYSKREFAKFFFCLLSDIDNDCEWKDFEDMLGKIRWEHILECIEDFVDVENEDDEDPFYYEMKKETSYSNEAQKCLESSHILKILFRDWIEYVNLSINKELKKDFFKNLDNNSFYLTFNYTNTLEIVYEIHNVCHIHGNIEKANSADSIIVGHGSLDFPLLTDNQSKYEAYEIFNEIFKGFYKETLKQLESHKDFFDSLQNVEIIYIYGLSLNVIDRAYFEYIFKKYKNIKKVFLYSYDPNEWESKKKKIMMYGFEGEIINWE